MAEPTYRPYVPPETDMKEFTARALVIGLVNALIRPILLVLTLPINVVTLGLFTLVVNALMFWLASSVVKGFDVADFKAAFLGALVFWLVSWAANAVFGTKELPQ